MARAFETAAIAVLDPGSCDQLSTEADPITDPYQIVSVREEYTATGLLVREIERANGFFTIELRGPSGQVISRAVFPNGKPYWADPQMRL
jgi:hypothetical protein